MINNIKIILMVTLAALLVSCGPKKGEIMDPSKIFHDEIKKCYHIKYKTIINDYDLEIPVYGGSEGIINYLTIYDHFRNPKSRRTLPYQNICLPIKTGGYDAIADVIEFYKKQGFLTEDSVKSPHDGLGLPRDLENGKGVFELSFYSLYKGKRFYVNFHGFLESYQEAVKNGFLSSKGLYEAQDKMKYLERLNKLKFVNNVIHYSFGVIEIDKN